MNDNQKAAGILRHYAGELYQGHTIGGRWPEESAHIEREHDELMALADRLSQERGEAVALQWQEKGNHKIYGTADCAFAQFGDLEHSVGPAGFEVYQSNDGWECTFWHGNRGHRICKSQSLRLQAQVAAQRHADKIAESIIKIAHPTPDAGRVAELERVVVMHESGFAYRAQSDRIAALESQLADLRAEYEGYREESMASTSSVFELLTESREREGRMREAVRPLTKTNSCKACGSSDVYWFSTQRNVGGCQNGRIRMDEIEAIFVLGCNTCSETIKTVRGDKVAEIINAALAADKEGE